MRGAFVTPHAVERFRARWAPALGYNHAKRELIVLTDNARPIKFRTYGGQEVWEAGESEKIWLVIKRDREGGAVVVTVLPAGSSDDGMVELIDPELE